MPDARHHRSRIRSATRHLSRHLPFLLVSGSLGLVPLSGCENGRNEMATDTRPRPVETEQVGTAGWVVSRPAPDMDGPVAVRMPGPTGGDGLIVRRDQPRTVRAGEPLQYTIEVENVSNTMMRDITVHEWRTGDFEIDRVRVGGSEPSSDASPQDGSGGGGQWSIGSLEPGERQLIQVEGVAPEEGSLATCMTVTYEPALCLTTTVVKPDLTITRTFEDEQAFACDPVPVRYTVRNTGTAAARNVVIAEELPDGLNGPGGADTIRFTIASLAPGETAERSSMIRADSPGTFSSAATVSSASMEARSREGTVAFVRPQLQMTVDAPEQEYVGRSLPIRITLENTGDAPALDTTVQVDGLSDMTRATLSTRRASISGDSIQCGRIDAGESLDMTLVFDADRPMSEELRFTAEAYCADMVRETIGIEVIGVPAIRLETIDLTDPVVVGGETTYEVRVKNQGTAIADDVIITATVPESMTYVRGTGDSNVTASGRTLRLGPIDALAPGETASWRIVTRADSPGRVQFRLELSSAATTTPARESEPTTVIDRPADIDG